MAGTRIVLDTEQVLSIATQIENDNQQLLDLLQDSKTTIDNLAATWTGDASATTIESYQSFANQYFQGYHDILDQYVKFLRTNVAEQYTETEQVNKQLADAFK